MKNLFIVLCLSMLTLSVSANSGVGESQTDCAAMASNAVDIDGADLDNADNSDDSADTSGR